MHYYFNGTVPENNLVIIVFIPWTQKWHRYIPFIIYIINVYFHCMYSQCILDNTRVYLYRVFLYKVHPNKYSYSSLCNICSDISTYALVVEWGIECFMVGYQRSTGTAVHGWKCHCNDVIISTTATLITSLTIVYSILYLTADQRKHQSSVSLAFVRGIHRRPVNSPHKGPVTRKMFPSDDVIMVTYMRHSPTMSEAPIQPQLLNSTK